MSALARFADSGRTSREVREVPCVDGSELARVFFTLAGWSVQPCVRPVSAAHRPLAIMPSADQVPVKRPHSTMHWHMWVVLIAGSTGSALRAVRSSNLHITPDARRNLVLRRKRDGLPVTLALSHHGPGHSGKLVGKRDGGDLGRSPGQQCREPGAVFGAVDLGIADDGERTGHEQAAQIAVTLFADAAEPVLAPARVLRRNEPDPGREVAS